MERGVVQTLEGVSKVEDTVPPEREQATSGAGTWEPVRERQRSKGYLAMVPRGYMTP